MFDPELLKTYIEIVKYMRQTSDPTLLRRLDERRSELHSEILKKAGCINWSTRCEVMCNACLKKKLCCQFRLAEIVEDALEE